MNVSTIAVPVTLAAILSYVFQFAKPLLEGLPGMRPTDASHDDALRIVYGALVFLAVGGYQLYTVGAPATFDGWLSLALAVLTTATTMAVAAHYNYQRMAGASSGAANAPVANVAPAQDASPTPPDFPPGAPSIAALGLPVAPASEPTPLAAAA